MAPERCVLRCEPDPDSEFHCDALADRLPEASAYDATAGELPALDDVDGVVVSGSTAGVYERDERPWIDDVEALVRDLVARAVPTLGVCFGHQAANAALGGRVEAADGAWEGLVEAELAPDPLFDGVGEAVDGEDASAAPADGPTTTPVPALHGDLVVEPGDDLAVIGSTAYCEPFATRHREAPLWTVQYHPELTAAARDRLVADYDWTDGGHDFAAIDADRVLENFRAIVAERTGGR